MKSISSLESNKVKNVIVVYDYAFVNGGAAKVAIQSAIGLSRKFHVCFFAAVGPICEELKNSDVEVKCLEGNDINSGSRIRAAVECIWNSYAAKAFKEILRQYSSQDTIVHIHGWAKALSSSVISTSTRCGFKTLVTLHDYFTVCPNGGFYNYKTNRICKYNGMSFRCFL